MPPTPTASEPIDRLAPTRRPEDWALMRHRWAHLLFLHWEVPPEALRPLVPKGLDLDLFEGRAFVGLVPFTMTGVRPTGLPPVWGISSFHEVNVRTYVHHAGRDPGVWFFSLDAASALGVRLARWSYHLPYHYARMSMEVADRGTAGPWITYASERRWPGPTPASCALEYGPTGPSAAAAPGTLDFFLIERYILYAEANGRLYAGRVHHSPYPVQPAEVGRLEETLIAAARIARPPTPPMIHYAREVRVRVYPLRPVAPPR